jgi:hypothetical protein
MLGKKSATLSKAKGSKEPEAGAETEAAADKTKKPASKKK